MTVGPREELPTLRGRQTLAAIDAGARTVFARKEILAATISHNAVEAGGWALRFLDEVGDRAQVEGKPGLSNRERAHEIAAPFVTAMVERGQRHGFRPDDDPKLTAVALISMINHREAGPT